MDLNKIIEGLGAKKEEIIRKAALCKNAEELLDLAKEYSVALDEAGAAKLLGFMHAKIGNLSDDELDAVSGGADKVSNVRCNECGNEFYLTFGTFPAPPLKLTPRCPQCNSTNLSMIK